MGLIADVKERLNKHSGKYLGRDIVDIKRETLGQNDGIIGRRGGRR